MKKLHLFALILGIVSMGFFTSCEEEEDPIGPEIVYQNYDGGDLSSTVGDSISFKFVVNEGDASIESVKVTIKGSNAVEATIVDNSDVKDGDEIPVSYTFAAADVYTVTITVVDKDGLDLVKEIKVTVEEGLSSLSNKTLGASDASTGSYLSIVNDMVYTQADAQTNVADVNIVYNYSATDGAQLYSPTVSNALKDLTGVTETTFIKTTLNFSTVTTAEVSSQNPTATKLTNLAVDDVIVFETAGGKKGIIKIVAIVESTDGTCTISIKVK